MQPRQRDELAFVCGRPGGSARGRRTIRVHWHRLGFGTWCPQAEQRAVEQSISVRHGVHAFVFDRLTAYVRRNVRIVITLWIVVVVTYRPPFPSLLVLGPVPLAEQDEFLLVLLVIGIIFQIFSGDSGRYSRR